MTSKLMTQVFKLSDIAENLDWDDDYGEEILAATQELARIDAWVTENGNKLLKERAIVYQTLADLVIELAPYDDPDEDTQRFNDALEAALALVNRE